jgi:hypothetical protein
VANGRWELVQPKVFRLSGAARTAEQALMAACLSAGIQAQASHRSAAWMWDLMDGPPDRPEVSVPPSRRPVLWEAIAHRPSDLDPNRMVMRQGIPCCDPLRTVFDLAGVVGPESLSQVIDRALSSRLVDASGIHAEIDRRAVKGRKGSTMIRRLMIERGLHGGPDASALEIEASKLFKRWGIHVQGREVCLYADGRYRIDFILAPTVAVEVDGFAHHWSPEAKRHDEERRNRIRLDGTFLLVYTWRDIRFDERRVVSEIMTALRQAA